MTMRLLCGAFMLAGAALLVTGCDNSGNRRGNAADFPEADRPIAPTVSIRYSSEEERDQRHEADDVMDRAGVRPGMTVADLGAGEGYYTVRLAERVGAKGRVLAEDIMPEIVEMLGRRVTREHLDNVSVKLGTPDDPKLPKSSFDRIFMVHMYHEIQEPYAFLWNLRSALKKNGEVVVVDTIASIEKHGMPPKLLICEFGALGYQLIGIYPNLGERIYIARFRPVGSRPEPGAITPCVIAQD